MNVRAFFSFLFLLIIVKISLTGLTLTWQLPAIPISTAGEPAGSPQVTMDPDGNAVAVWTRFDGTHYLIQGATFNALTSSWSSVNISAAGQDANQPQVAVNKSGIAVAVWSRFNGTHYIIQASTTQTPTNIWSAPIDISNLGDNSQEPYVGIDADGNAVAIWQIVAPDESSVIASATFTNGSWHTPTVISGQSAIMPALAVNPSGEAVAVWRKCNGRNGIIQADKFTPANGWSANIRNLSDPGESAFIPQVGIDQNGNAVAIWRRSNGNHFVIQASTLSGGNWSSAVDLSDGGSNADSPQIAVGLGGRAVACWSIRKNSVTSLIQSAESRTQTPNVWSEPTQLTSDNDAYKPDVALKQGSAVLIWSIANCTTPFVSSIQADSTDFSDVEFNQTLDLFGPSDPADEAKVAISSDDINVMSVWRGFDGSNNRIWAARGIFSSAPEICITPTIGREQGGTIVRILAQSGTNLNSTTAVLFGSTPATSFNIISNNEVIAIAPPGIGVVNVSVTTSSGTSPAANCNEYTYINRPPETPSICISPTTGPTTGGTSVTIIAQSGTNLLGTTAVSFGAIPASSFQIVSNDEITAIAPPGAGTVNVRVTTPIGISAIANCNSFTYTNLPPQLPEICIKPTNGPTGGNTQVTITAQSETDLGDVIAVSFGLFPAISFEIISSSEIIAISPPGTGNVNVTVTTSAGTSFATNCNEFTYTDFPPQNPHICIDPTNGPITGGTEVRIMARRDTDLRDVTDVSFGTTPATSFRIVSKDEIIAISPAGTGIVNVSVTTPNGASPTANCNEFTYIGVPPHIPEICINPKSGPTAGGTEVRIHAREGTNLNNTTAVFFGDIPATSFNIISKHEIIAISPAGTGTVSVTVITPNGSSSAANCNEFTYTNNPPTVPLPPREIHVKQVKNQFATQTDIINIVKWSPSPTPGVTSYHLFRNGELIAKIPAHEKLSFKDHNRKKGGRTVYAVTALIGQDESEPTKIVFKK